MNPYDKLLKTVDLYAESTKVEIVNLRRLNEHLKEENRLLKEQLLNNHNHHTTYTAYANHNPASFVINTTNFD